MALQEILKFDTIFKNGEDFHKFDFIFILK